MSNIFAIDPGNVKSAFLLMGDTILDKGILPNEKLIEALQFASVFGDATIVIEMVASYGMAVGKTVFDTCVWIGQFCREADINKIPYALVYRKDIKMHICGTMRAKDTNIIQALKDRYGEVGTKNNQGPLYGVSKDIWSALAVATYYKDVNNNPFNENIRRP